MNAEGGKGGAVPAIEVEGLSFSYPGGTRVLDGLAWEVPAGAFMLLVGATGSGKTTLLRSCKPEIAPAGERSGSIRAFGVPLEEWSAAESAAGIGFVSQSPGNQIVCDRVWHELAFGLENIGLPQPAMRRRVAEVAHFFGIGPLMDRATCDLSGGQQQLVNLAAVLALQPRLLLLDEPTAQLDPVAEKNFLHALFRINRELGITVVVSTHAPETMVDYASGCTELAGSVAHAAPLDRFRAAASGSPQVGKLRKLLRAQAAAGEDVPAAGAPAGAAPAGTVTASRRLSPVILSGGGRKPAAVEGSCAPAGAAPSGAPAVPVAASGVPAVALSDVRFRYAKDAPEVLRGCDLQVARGSVHAVVGGNGSGKSTLLNLVAGVLRPERGRVRNGLAARQVLLPQDPKALFVCDTVRDELAEWRDRCGYGDADIAQVVERFCLRGLEGRHPYDLSGGQQQRLAWAKVLLTDPELLLMDEPTKGLDAPSRMQSARTLLECAREGRTVVMVTHDLMFAALAADEVSLLFDGEITCTEPAEEFFAGNLFYRPVFDGLARLLVEGAGGAEGAAGAESAADGEGAEGAAGRRGAASAESAAGAEDAEGAAGAGRAGTGGAGCARGATGAESAAGAAGGSSC